MFRSGFNRDKNIETIVHDLLKSRARSRIYIFLLRKNGAKTEDIIKGTKLHPSTVRETLSKMYDQKQIFRKKIKNDSTPCKAICSNFEYLCKGENEKMVRKTISRFLFGSDKDKFSAKINFTHLYKDKENENYLLNVFGFVPNKVSFENKTLEFNIRSIKNILYIEFGNPYNEEYGVSCLSEVIK